MRPRPLVALLAGLLVAVAVAPAVAQTPPSCLDYTPDPRVEAEKGPATLTQADALVATASSFLPSSDATMLRMQVFPWTDFHAYWVPACRRRDYHGQPWSGVGSAILVGKETLLTAGHLFLDPPYGVPCDQQRYVFGYGNFIPNQWQMTCDTSGTCWVNVPAEDVYRCVSVVRGGVQPGTSGDWAVVTMDRTIQGEHGPLHILRDQTQFPPVGSPVTIVGHPNRIPMKAENVQVRYAGPSYGTSGHILHGHSGSMAVDDATGAVIGVVVSAGIQLLPGCQPPNNQCYREWFENPSAGAWLTPAWLAKDYIPEF